MHCSVCWLFKSNHKVSIPVWIDENNPKINDIKLKLIPYHKQTHTSNIQSSYLIHNASNSQQTIVKPTNPLTKNQHEQTRTTETMTTITRQLENHEKIKQFRRLLSSLFNLASALFELISRSNNKLSAKSSKDKHLSKQVANRTLNSYSYHIELRRHALNLKLKKYHSSGYQLGVFEVFWSVVNEEELQIAFVFL